VSRDVIRAPVVGLIAWRSPLTSPSATHREFEFAWKARSPHAPMFSAEMSRFVPCARVSTSARVDVAPAQVARRQRRGRATFMGIIEECRVGHFAAARGVDEERRREWPAA